MKYDLNKIWIFRLENMKRSIIYMIGLFLLLSCQVPQDRADNKITAQVQISFADTLHDFGIIPLSAPIDSCDFWIKNTGKRPLVVLGLQTSCHCVKANCSARTIQAGDSACVRVTYDGRGHGEEYFGESVLVYTNASELPQRLIVRGQLE